MIPVLLLNFLPVLAKANEKDADIERVAVSPPLLLRADRANALRKALYMLVTAEVLIVGLVGAASLNLGLMATTLRITFECGCLAASGRLLFTTAWGRWTMARASLAVTGRLPWRLLRFLEDAHQRGVLRQVGGVYEFRNARLRELLR